MSVQRLLDRLSERTRAPRSWWFPRRDDPALGELPQDRIQQDFLEISSNIAKTVVTILAFSFFCVFTLLGAPDRELIAAGAQITIPVAKVGVSFAGFLVLGPLLLLAFFVHLHIFVAYWLSLFGIAEKPRRGAYVFNLPFPSARLLSSALFYWLVPVVIGVFAWKAAPQPVAGRLLFLTFCLATIWTLLTQIRRCPESRRRWNAPRWILLAAAALALASSSGLFGSLDLYSSLRSLRGGMKLAGADLTSQNLSGRFLENADLTGAILKRANLMGASLTNAILNEANLSGADLSSADLESANLTDADLAPTGPISPPSDVPGTEPEAEPAVRTRLVRANLTAAILEGADLTGADLEGAELRGARLGASESGRSATLTKAKLTGAGLESAILRHANLRGADLVRAKMRGAVLSGAQLTPADDGAATDLTEAALLDSDLSGADLRGAILRGANLTRANLSDVDLRESTRLARDQVASACIEDGRQVLLPEGLSEQPPPCDGDSGDR